MDTIAHLSDLSTLTNLKFVLENHSRDTFQGRWSPSNRPHGRSLHYLT